MNDKPESLYCGDGKEIQRQDKPPYLRVSLNLDELQAKLGDHFRTVNFKSGPARIVTLICAPLKPENVTQYRTHSLKIDTWKPDPSKPKQGYADKRTTSADRVPADTVQGDVDNVPF
jgi:hypothetical protein